MNIPGSEARGKDFQATVHEGGQPASWLPWAVLALAVSASFALGMLAGKEAATENATEDRFWIEQLPPEALVQPGEGSETGAAPVPASGGTAPIGAGAAAVGTVLTPATGTYVASKSGTKYYLPSCSGASRIKEENKVWFATKTEAEAAGYEPAANCSGI